MNKTIGKNLNKLRNVSAYTQDEIASALGITRSAYSNYESGEREMPFDLLEKASNLFGCELYVFFEEEVSVDDMILASAFRLDSLCEKDLKEICQFKDIVKSYLKMDQLATVK
ncbi:helix-turn-helix transcriptional regulator [Xylanibacter oryzae]|uniref:helix-turn-helix transcriptional regulator n=1 Tax=Xylanibacter oryzae TaxID=185293 RepID=UPI0004B911CC|nr:helix-turn-helix transcriptional regulator [Xylanibacter oryzae]